MCIVDVVAVPVVIKGHAFSGRLELGKIPVLGFEGREIIAISFSDSVTSKYIRLRPSLRNTIIKFPSQRYTERVTRNII